MNRTKQKYAWLYARRVLFLTVLLLLLTGILPVLVAISPYSAGWDVWLVAWLLPTFVFIDGCVHLLRIVGFYRSISRQEQRYHTVFNDNGAVRLNRNKMVYLSGHWLIFAGQVAVYREHIWRVTHYEKCSKGSLRYYVRIQTQDGRQYRFRLADEKDWRKIRSWAG